MRNLCLTTSLFFFICLSRSTVIVGSVTKDKNESSVTDPSSSNNGLESKDNRQSQKYNVRGRREVGYFEGVDQNGATDLFKEEPWVYKRVESSNDEPKAVVNTRERTAYLNHRNARHCLKGEDQIDDLLSRDQQESSTETAVLKLKFVGRNSRRSETDDDSIRDLVKRGEMMAKGIARERRIDLIDPLVFNTSHIVSSFVYTMIPFRSPLLNLLQSDKHSKYIMIKIDPVFQPSKRTGSRLMNDPDLSLDNVLCSVMDKLISRVDESDDEFLSVPKSKMTEGSVCRASSSFEQETHRPIK